MAVGWRSGRSVPEPGEAIHLGADGEEGALDPWTPGFNRFVRRLEHRNALVALILDLDVADQLEVANALLQVGDALGEVAAPVVGDDGGGVLVGGEALQGFEAAVDNSSTLSADCLRIGEALIEARPEAVELGAHSIEALEQLVEHLSNHRIHGTPVSLEASVVGVGRGMGLQRWKRPEIVGFDTTVGGADGIESEA